MEKLENKMLYINAYIFYYCDNFFLLFKVDRYNFLKDTSLFVINIRHVKIYD